MILEKIKAFIRKDFLIESSYKISFFITLLSSVFPVVTYYFVGKLVNADVPSIQKYGVSYYSFALVGIAFSSYFVLSINTFSTSIKRAQMAGCLEAILSSQTSPESVVLLSSLYSFISAAVQLVLAFSIGTFFFDFPIGNINVFSTLVVFLIALLLFVGLGIISAAGTIIFKQGEPFGWIFGALSSLLGGAFFPLEVLPEPIRIISYIVPITYALEALRFTMLKGLSLSEISSHLITLFLLAITIFPLSLYFFRWAVEKGRRDGTLMQY